MSFWAIELFGVSPRVSYTLRHFSGFHQWIRCLTRFSGFSPEGGIYPLLAPLDTFQFPFSFNTVELNWTSSHSQGHTINTKCSAKSVPCMHSHVMWCYRTPMQCNLCHCTLTHDQCMKTSTWTFYTIHCVCYEHSCLMHTTFHIFSSTSTNMQSC